MKKPTLIPLILALVFGACGKQGPPMPPVPIIPRETTDLAAIQRGPKVVLAWAYPAYTTTGMSLPGIRRIIVLRFDETASADAPADEPFGAVITPQQFVKQARVVGEIEGKDLPGYVEGARILFTERPAIQGAAGATVRYTYAVVTEGDRGRSAPSNLASIVPDDTPLPPSGLTAEVTPPAVVLTWRAPEKTILGNAAGTIEGYFVYRLPPVGASDEPLSPINAKPVEETRFEDTPPYGTYHYAVTAVVHGADPRIESELPLLIEANYRDLLAPPPPDHLNALVEEDAVRLVWDGVTAGDLAGYKVYREVDGARSLLTTELLKETFFVDPSPMKGKEVVYFVTSVDDKGNESEPSATGTVLVAE